MRGCINFTVSSCTIDDVKDVYFCIGIGDYKRKFYLKAHNRWEAREWVDRIQKVIDDQILTNHLKIKTILWEKYFNDDTISEEDFIREV